MTRRAHFTLNSDFPPTPASSVRSPGECFRQQSVAWLSVRPLIMALALLAPAAVWGQDVLAAKLAPRGDESAEQAKEAEPAWQPLFDGTSLEGWKASQYGGQGEIVVRDGVIDLGMGSPLTGITYTRKMPTCDYEVRVEAMRIDGNDFFSTITFPVNESFCSLVVGGWGGAVVGISCINRSDASENETTKFMKFESKKWYNIRVEVRKDHINAWIDGKPVVDVDIKNRQLSTRTEVFLSEPFGITSYITRAGIRKIELRELPPETGK